MENQTCVYIIELLKVAREKRLTICVLSSLIKSLLKLVEKDDLSESGSSSQGKARLLAQ